jgi:hypothetical protein
MIRAATGEFKLDDYELVIHPELTLPQLKAGDIPIVRTTSPNKMGSVFCWFNGRLDGLEAEFTMRFQFDTLHLLSWELTDCGDFSGEQLKGQLEGWLLKTVGHPPPYEYDWGFISCGIDTHSGAPSVGVMFKSSILEMGFNDVAAFYEFHRAQN